MADPADRDSADRNSADGDPADHAPVPERIAIHGAERDDRLDVLRVLDAAMLETDADDLAARIDAGDALVARFERTGSVVGALVATRPEPGRRHVDAVAVRRARRGRGIGSALVARAVRDARADPEVDAVTATFDADLTGFYAALGFTIESTEEGRARGRRAVRGPDPNGG